MKKNLILLFTFTALSFVTQGQPNCNVYTDSPECFKACQLAIEASDAQGTRASQELFDKAIGLCPTLDYAYFEKSVPYLKRGELATWKRLLDKAVELNPSGHLGYRAWTRFEFVHDFQGALDDFKTLRNFRGKELGYSQNGDYNLNIVEALCYYKLGDTKKAIAMIEQHLAESAFSPGSFDYLHLGILKLSVQNYTGAIEAFQKQISINDYLADTYYYLAIAYRDTGKTNAFKSAIDKAHQMYTQRLRRSDPYVAPLDKVYLSDIEKLRNVNK